MRKVREVLRLYFAAKLSIRAIARSLGSSPSTVGGYLRRAKVAGLIWPLPASLDEAGLERRLFPAPPSPRTKCGTLFKDRWEADPELLATEIANVTCRKCTDEPRPSPVAIREARKKKGGES